MNKKTKLVKSGLYSEGIKDISKFTRTPNVYINFSDEEEEQITKDKRGKSKSKEEKTNKKEKENQLGKKRLRGESADRSEDNSAEEERRKTRSSLVKEKAFSTKPEPLTNTNKLASLQPSKNSAERNIKKIINYEKEIFNADFDEEIVIEKKEEFRQVEKVNKFKQAYFHFLKDEKLAPVNQDLNANSHLIITKLEKLSELYNFVSSKGGYEEVIARGHFSQFIRENPELYSTTEEARRQFIDYLYYFSLYSTYIKDCKSKLTDKEAREIFSKGDPNMLLECPVIYASEADSEEEITKKIQEAMKYDLVILRGFLPAFRLNNSIFNIDYIEKKYNLKNKIDVIEQASSFTGFTKNKHERKQWKLGDYLKYVREQESELKGANKTKKSAGNSDKNKSHIYYGVNIELSEYKELHEELEKRIHPLMLFGSSYDPLAYVRQHIKGMTIPQMYIKVPGVWTGGHEENLRMRSINICHGPGESLWWSCPVEDSKKLVDKVKTQYNTDIYKKEGIWFPDMNFFYNNGIRLIYTVQKPGDIVLVGQGTIHWVKARSHSINTSWNFGSKDSRSLQLSMARYQINKEIKFRSLVPMMTLILDILNHEMDKLDLSFVETCRDYLQPVISSALSDTHSTIAEIKKKTNCIVMKELESYLVENCEECVQEVFNWWAYCQVCSEKRKDQQVILCIPCYKNHMKTCNKYSQHYIFFKYEEEDLKKFLQRLEIRLKYNNTLSTFEKELKEVQPGLTKKTTDSKCIAEKKVIKIIPQYSEEEMRLYEEFGFIYREYDINEVSECLVPLIDNDRLRSEDFLRPLKRKVFGPPEYIDEEGKIWPNKEVNVYMDFDDLIEDINLKRFSPIREVQTYNREEDVDMAFDINNNNYINNDYPLMHVDSQIPPTTSNLFDGTPTFETKNFSATFNPTTNININYKPSVFNFHSGLPGKSLIASLVVNPDLNMISNPSLLPNSEFSDSQSAKSKTPLRNSLNKSVHNFKGNTGVTTNNNINSSVNPSQTLNELKDNLKSQDEKNVAYDPCYEYNMKKTNWTEKDRSRNEVKKAISYLKVLTIPSESSNYKFVSPENHSQIFVAKKLILKNIENKEVMEELKLKSFIEKIITNQHLISEYRDMFREEIYEII